MGLLLWRRTPDRGSDVAFRAGGLVSEVVHCNDFTVRPLDGPHVTDIAAGPVVAEGDGVAPGPAPVAAKDGANAVGLGPVAIDQADPSVLQFDHRGRVAHALRQAPPRSGIPNWRRCRLTGRS